MIRAAIEIRNYLENRNSLSEINWKIRIGIHSGKVIGGIVGIRKYIYDVFGDTINTTSRMESNSRPMEINVSETTYDLVKDTFQFTPRKPMEIKGKGVMKMYFLKHIG
jgi:class 3 adenylate cyclase